MITGLYAAIAALLIVALSRNVINLRQQYNVCVGDGGHVDLQAVIRARTSSLDYIPIGLLLLLLLEIAGNPAWLLHACGIVFMLVRIVHANALTKGLFKQCTFLLCATMWILLIMAGLNLFSFLGFQLNG